MKTEYQCHNPLCKRAIEAGSLAVFEINSRRTFCSSESSPLEDCSCARKFIEYYAKQLVENYGCLPFNARKIASEGNYVFIKLENKEE